jgi:hypothetical protein
MLITRKSQISGIERTLEISCTPEQYQDWQNGTLIQKAMPNVPLWEREFLITGVTQDEWDTHIVDNED